MTRKLITINYEIPGFSDDYDSYFGDQSLLDADVVVFAPQQFSSSYEEDGSREIRRQTEHWRGEISTALEYGKTIFILLGKHQTFQIHTGKKDFKGRTTINYVQDFDNYQFLPTSIPPLISKGGTEIIFTGNVLFANFWKEFKSYLKYESYLDGKISNPVFITRTGERPVGGVLKVGKGNLVFLPLINYDERKFTTSKDGKRHWNNTALQFGHKLVEALLEIDKGLRSELQKTPPPNWVQSDEFVLEIELKIKRDIETVEAELTTLKNKKVALEEDLNKAVEIKDLLFETGKTLERAVNLALEMLGYKSENYNDGELELDHVILSPEGERFIGECEGKDSSAINVEKFRQLEDNIQSDLQREDVTEPAIGILFGNGFRLTEPRNRAEQFTAKCLLGAKRGTILVRTADLYPLVKYLQQRVDLEFTKACREAISSSRGKIVKFPTIPS